MPCIIDMREKGGPRQQRKAFDVWTLKPLRAGRDETFQVATANRADTRRMPPVTALLEADGTAPVKQRHTAERISKRPRFEQGYGGGLMAVEDYVLIAWGRLRRTFRPRRRNTLDVSCGSVG